jgi:hypothetical protein
MMAVRRELQGHHRLSGQVKLREHETRLKWWKPTAEKALYFFETGIDAPS